MLPKALLLLLCTASAITAATTTTLASTPSGLVSQFSLDQSGSLPAPPSALENVAAVKYMTSSWSLNGGKLQAGKANIEFVDDPFDVSSSATPVLRVAYDKGSYGGSTGAQFLSEPINNGSDSGSMLLSYDLAFSPNFVWNKGGKIPGLRGGPDAKGCSGGEESGVGTTCFSTRLMWRASGQGEIYAYIPMSSDACKATDVVCNSDYGISLSRGKFTLKSGVWQKISLFVQLNSPSNVANGRVLLFLNDTLVLSHTNLQLRSSDSIASVSGLWFSTFFGGSDATWASPSNQSSYYRNFQIQAGAAVSDGPGNTVSSSNSSSASTSKSAADLIKGSAGLVRGAVASAMVAVLMGLLL